ncbi:MAG: type II toxin-antitoxin system RelE/ParE family toxin [Ginsengibacter sp.]
MIVSIVHKGLKGLWIKDDPSGLPPEQIEKIRRILEALDSATTLAPLKVIPGYKLHQLKGKLKGYWSVWVTRNYRITFRFEKENVHVVDYQDYH